MVAAAQVAGSSGSGRGSPVPHAASAQLRTAGGLEAPKGTSTTQLL